MQVLPYQNYTRKHTGVCSYKYVTYFSLFWWELLKIEFIKISE